MTCHRSSSIATCAHSSTPPFAPRLYFLTYAYFATVAVERVDAGFPRYLDVRSWRWGSVSALGVVRATPAAVCWRITDMPQAHLETASRCLLMSSNVTSKTTILRTQLVSVMGMPEVLFLRSCMYGVRVTAGACGRLSVA